MSANETALKKAARDVMEAMAKVDLAIRDKLASVEIKRRGQQFSQAAKIYAAAVEAYK